MTGQVNSLLLSIMNSGREQKTRSRLYDVMMYFHYVTYGIIKLISSHQSRKLVCFLASVSAYRDEDYCCNLTPSPGGNLRSGVQGTQCIVHACETISHFVFHHLYSLL